MIGIILLARERDAAAQSGSHRARRRWPSKRSWSWPSHAQNACVGEVCYGLIGNRMMEGYAREAQRIVLEGASPPVDGALSGAWRWEFCRLRHGGCRVGVNVRRANASRYPPDPSCQRAKSHCMRRVDSGRKAVRLLPLSRAIACVDDPDAIEILRRRSVELQIPQRVHPPAKSGTLFVPADERRLPRARRGHRAARGRHRCGVDVRGMDFRVIAVGRCSAEVWGLKR